MVWTATGGVRKNIKAKMLNIALVVGLVASLALPNLSSLLGNKALAATTVHTQAELVSAIAGSETVIDIGASFSVTSQVDINRTLTLNGNGHTISTTYTATGGGNDTAIAVVGGNPIINNLVIDGVAGVNTQGVQVWESAATLNNITSKNNDKAGIHVNNSTVTILNANTSNNGANFGGILVSAGGTATINGTSTHAENTNSLTGQIMDVYLSIVGTRGSIVDTNSQYNSWHDIIYTLKPIVDNQKPTVSNISIAPTISDNIGRTVTVTFDLDDATGIDLTKTRVLFTDGPDLPHKAKESATFVPVLVSGNTYKVVIDTTTFLKKNNIGNYNLTFRPYDTLGNGGSFKPEQFRLILIDNSGPSVTLASPASGSVISSTQRFVFNITDDTGVASGYMKLNGPTNKQVNLTHDSGDLWYADIDTTTLSDGNYTIDVRPIDVFGTERYNANRGNVTIDNTAPVWNDTDVHESPANGAEITEGSNILMQWVDATDPNGVKYYYNVSAVSGATTGPDNALTDPFWPPTFGPLTVSQLNATGTALGTYWWQVKACDDLGNCTPWTNPWQGSVVEEQLEETTTPQVAGANTGARANTNRNLPIQIDVARAEIAPPQGQQAADEVAEDENTEEVAGVSDEENGSNNFANSNSLGATISSDATGCSKILGLCWYYWPPIIVAAILGGYYLYSRREADSY